MAQNVNFQTTNPAEFPDRLTGAAATLAASTADNTLTLQ